MMTIKNYIRPESLEEAYQLNQSKSSRILGGMLWLKTGNGSIDTAIDLCNLGLDSIEETGMEFKIGAMVSLRELEMHAPLNALTNGAIRNALKDIVGVQFRNMATVGGSIWGRFGFSDVLTVFLALDCSVELFRAGVVSLEEFISMPKDDDILVRLIVKKTPCRVAYASMRNQRTDFPVIACAVSEVAGEIRAAIGARPAKAMLLRDEEGLVSGGVNADSAKAFAAYAAAHAPTQSNVRASAEYRTHLIGVLIERAMMEMGGKQ